MLSKWPILYKSIIGFCVLIAIVGVLTWGSMRGLYAYRSLVRTLSRRVAELPAANQLAHDVADLRVCLAENRPLRAFRIDGGMAAEQSRRFARDEFVDQMRQVEQTLSRYRSLLTTFDEDYEPIGDNHREMQVVHNIEHTVKRINESLLSQDWIVDEIKVTSLQTELEQLQELSSELPSYLHSNIGEFTEEVRGQYRALITLSWATSVATGVMLAVFLKLCYDWIYRPIQTLIKGSRRVAGGDFNYRIQVDTDDEIGELARAMNDMTERFQLIRDDLDDQVQEQTTRLLRSEHMVSVGFLAAGVAHEINNPLAAIAMSAESIEERLFESIAADHPDREVFRKYLSMIQEEAFRCKEITSKLLDFSRVGEVQCQATNLGELVKDVIELIETIGEYQDKQLTFSGSMSVFALANPHQIKQVALNLIVNGLHAIEPGGHVSVEVTQTGGMAQLVIADNGCGMTDEVRRHLFEPFFTRKAIGQGTGLGLSIAYRIVTDHKGTIDVHSPGPNQGSRFVVKLPLARSNEEVHHRNAQAA